MKKLIIFTIFTMLVSGSLPAMQVSGNIKAAAPVDISFYDITGKPVLIIKIDGKGEFVSEQVKIIPDIYLFQLGDIKEYIYLDKSDMVINGTIDVANIKNSKLEFHNIEANERFQMILQKYRRNDSDSEIIKPYITEGKIDPRASTAFYYAAMITRKKPRYIYEQAKPLLDMASENEEKNASYSWLKDIVDSIAVYRIGGPVPDFSFENTDGKKVSLSDFKGKYVVVDFWASWCAPCLQEIQKMKQGYPEFKGNPDVVFISVSMDGTKAEWEQGLNKTQIPWVSLWEQAEPGQQRENWFNISPLKDRYGFRSIPFVMIVDKEGNYLARDVHMSELKKILDVQLNKR